MNLHMGRRERGRGVSLLSFFFLSSVVLPFHSPPLSLSLYLSRSLSLLSLLSLSPSARHFFFLCSVFFFKKFFCLQSALRVSLLNDNDNDRSSSWLSLCTRSLACLECARAVAHFIVGEHVRNMHENNCPSITVQTSCHLE